GGTKKVNYHASYNIGNTREQLLQVRTGCIQKPQRKQRALLRETVNLSGGKLRKDDEECPELFGQKQRMCPNQSINEAVKCIRLSSNIPGGRISVMVKVIVRTDMMKFIRTVLLKVHFEEMAAAAYWLPSISVFTQMSKQSIKLMGFMLHVKS
ncbi:hypothetical protein ANCCAN_00129, partial [Ancylostoma caninum]